MAKSERIALERDQNDPEDFDVTEAALETALTERSVRRGRGRPVGSFTSGKEKVTLRLDSAALNVLRAAGPGWQTRVNEAVRKAAGL